VAQQAFGIAIGQRQMGMRQHLEDRVPVVEELAAERGGLPVLGTPCRSEHRRSWSLSCKVRIAG
jgi:hypothetical protein